jgi:uncharacterized protein
VIVDAHATIGRNRSVELTADELVASMDELGVDLALVSPPDAAVAADQRSGNELVAAAAARFTGRLRPYAVASPWLGTGAVEELRRAAAGGAAALKLDPGLQGFDLLDRQAEPLLRTAAGFGWPVYVRTGTPPAGLPLALAELARRFPDTTFLLGKAGATDFSLDGPEALARADNLVTDTSYVMWPLGAAASLPGRVVFASDAPFSDAAVELWRVREAGLDAATLHLVLGGTMLRVLGMEQP